MGGRDGGVRTKNTNNVNNTNKFKGAPLHGHKVNCKLSQQINNMNDYNMTNSANPIKKNQKIF